MKFIIKALLILLPFVAFGQNRTYLGIEVGPKFDVYKYADNGDGLYTKPFLFSPIYGLTLEQELYKTLSLETGFFINDYGQSYRIVGEFGYTVTNAIVAFQIPFRLKSHIDLFKNKIHLVTTVGYTFAINNNYTSSGSGSNFSAFSRGAQAPFNDSTRSEHETTYGLQKTYGLIEAGISLDYRHRSSMVFYLSANYLTGLKRVIEMDVKYWINDEPEQTGTVFSNGDYYSFVFGIKYPISKFWNNKVKPTR